MTAENLFERLRRQPFVPFRVYLSGGTSYDVRHPEMMVVTRTGVTIALHDPSQTEDEIPERQVLLSLLHITSTEDLKTQSAA